MKTLRTVMHNGTSYEYGFEVKKVKNLNLRVRHDGSLSVSAPRTVSTDAVDAFVLSHIPFIENARARMRQRKETSASAIKDGGMVFYRGERYTLCIREGKEQLTFADGVAVLRTPYPHEPEKVAKAWDRKIKELFYPMVCQACRAREADLAALHIAPPKEIRLRKMTSMWGNCRSHEGVLTFSTMLASVPPMLLDYVVCHELCHLKYADHSARFYRLLGEICPNYLSCRKALRAKTYMK